MARLFTISALILFQAVLLSLAAPRSDGSGRIVGGQDAPEGFAPYLASLLYQDFGHFGAANIISERWLVTDGHCLFGIPETDITIYVGSNQLSRGGQTYEPEKFFVIEGYNPEEWYKGDVGVIKTKLPFQWSDKVKPIALARNLPADRALTIQVGWGSTLPGTRENITVPDNMQLLLSPYVELQRCVEIVGGKEWTSWVSEVTVCTHPLELQGTCFGDSGGAVVFNDELLGMPSWVGDGICGNGIPDFSTSIPHFYDWIQETVEANS